VAICRHSSQDIPQSPKTSAGTGALVATGDGKVANSSAFAIGFGRYR
jgi:hypothetical protein